LAFSRIFGEFAIFSRFTCIWELCWAILTSTPLLPNSAGQLRSSHQAAARHESGGRPLGTAVIYSAEIENRTVYVLSEQAASVLCGSICEIMGNRFSIK